MNKSESIAELASAMSQFQSVVKQPLKDKTNPFFKSKYVPLENIVEVITETAFKYGLSFMQYPVNNDKQVGIVTIVMHKSGEYIETDPVFATPAKGDAQAAGSVITYLKRYSLAAVFGITSDEDDDGNRASHPQNSNNNLPKDLPSALMRVAAKNNVETKEVYEAVTKELGISKATKDLTEQEKLAIISLLNKQ